MHSCNLSNLKIGQFMFWKNLNTDQAHYNMPHYNTDSNLTRPYSYHSTCTLPLYNMVSLITQSISMDSIDSIMMRLKCINEKQNIKYS